jgi:hypothetical protein
MQGGKGTSMGGSEMSPARRKRNAARRRAQDKAWASRSSEVTVRRVGDPKPDTPAGVPQLNGHRL